MDINLGVAAQTPQFAKKIRRIRSSFEPFFDAFSQVSLVNPIHDAILIGVTDAKPKEYFEEIFNRDGYFQILAGMPGDGTDQKLKEILFEIIKQSIKACPFSRPDKEGFLALMAEWESKLLKA
jgi:hypothetical protein